MDQASQYREDDARRLAGVTLDLLGAMLARAARSEGTLAPETQHAVLRARVSEFIHRHLGDPDLTPASIAAAHQVSVRYLHRLYQGQGATIADGIRRRRLERIHRDLADPRLQARSISSIAARWGFLEPTQFSRAFRTMYRITPRDHRRLALPGTQSVPIWDRAAWPRPARWWPTPCRRRRGRWGFGDGRVSADGFGWGIFMLR
jgi:AraC-like DNA-binding protein